MENMEWAETSKNVIQNTILLCGSGRPKGAAKIDTMGWQEKTALAATTGV